MLSFRVGVRANYMMCVLAPEASGVTMEQCSANCAPLASSYGCDGNGQVVTYPSGVGACTNTADCRCYSCNGDTCGAAPANANQSLSGLYTSLDLCATDASSTCGPQIFTASSLSSTTRLTSVVVADAPYMVSLAQFTLKRAMSTVQNSSCTFGVTLRNQLSTAQTIFYALGLVNARTAVYLRLGVLRSTSVNGGANLPVSGISVAGTTTLVSSLNWAAGDVIYLMVYTKQTSVVLAPANVANLTVTMT